jgi:hypothetical protein
MKATVKLTEARVTDIIREYFQAKGKAVHDVSIQVRMGYEDRPAGGSYPEFESIDVTVDL